MEFFKTYDKDGFLRLEEDNGAALSLYLHGENAYLVSIIVPENDRREGIGSALLEASWEILSERGIKQIEADFFRSLPGFCEFMKKNGFETEESAPLYSMDIDELLASPVLTKGMKKDVKGASFSSLSKLSAMEWSAFFHFTKKLGACPTNSDFKGYDKGISGVVLDDNGEIKASVLCSRTEDRVYVEFLSGDAKTNPAFIMCALQGVARGIEEVHTGDGPKSLLLVSVNDGVKGLLKTFEKAGLKSEEKDMCVFAKLPVSKEKKKSGDLTVIESIDDNLENRWLDETEDIPFQKNISWKLPFSRGERLV